MTAQISDTIHYRKVRYDLAGVNGTGLFDPAEHGLEAVGWVSSCWRGFRCTYEVAEGALLLTEIDITLSEENRAAVQRGEGLLLFGKVPVRFPEYKNFPKLRMDDQEISGVSPARLEGLRAIVPFTGGLLLGSEFIREMYVHMGFHPAYKFRQVHELVFDAGRLIEEHDRSALMARIRERLESQPLEPVHLQSQPEMEAWIARCFSLKYDGFTYFDDVSEGDLGESFPRPY